MTTVFSRPLRAAIWPPPSGMNLWMVVKTTPPLARVSSSAKCSRLSACTGIWPRMSWQRWNWPKSWSSRSLRSVSTTRVGLCIALSRITRAAKNSMVKLFPLPCVCHTTPGRRAVPGSEGVWLGFILGGILVLGNWDKWW